jgi:hypothetical protein
MGFAPQSALYNAPSAAGCCSFESQDIGIFQNRCDISWKFQVLSYRPAKTYLLAKHDGKVDSQPFLTPRTRNDATDPRAERPSSDRKNRRAAAPAVQKKSVEEHPKCVLLQIQELD